MKGWRGRHSHPAKVRKGPFYRGFAGCVPIGCCPHRFTGSTMAMPYSAVASAVVGGVHLVDAAERLDEMRLVVEAGVKRD